MSDKKYAIRVSGSQSDIVDVLALTNEEHMKLFEELRKLGIEIDGALCPLPERTLRLCG